MSEPKPRRSFWFSRSTIQAQTETLLIGGGIWLIMIIFQMSYHLSASSNPWKGNNNINALCLLWSLFRIAPPEPLWSKGLLKQIFASFAISLPLYLLYIVSMYLLLSPGTSTQNAAEFYFLLLLSAVLSLFYLLFFTGIACLFHFWNRLRQRSLHWTLIHAHVVILIFVSAIASVFYVLSIQQRAGLTFDFVLLSGFFFFLIFFSIFVFIILLLMMPLFIVFAYIVTRPTIKRITELVAVTNRLRIGHYEVRAPVAGKDEVAQLQKNFNAMADKIEQIIRDLQTERDYVALLLNERRELFANVSHELRTPIAILRGYLESDLKNRPQIAEALLWEDIETMEREVLQLQERADELFALSKAEVKPIVFQAVPCDVYQLVQTLMKSCAPLAWRTNKVEMVADMPDEIPRVSADEQRLEQALKNIIRNALRHTPPGGVIALIVTIEPERVGISVEDTGEGIAPEELEHIWERFYQAKTPQQGGAGIGLSLVKEWITGMGGSVAAASTLGEGSCFTLYLPRLR
ncbi:HAMP domain-containing histidine kinase [Ktedonosporobacter rubrisoli]|uniref:histidine kinase n=1 Tax=Ktedonosporobacter rubrisoli TaxID=2509675 RepID=A0A4P6JQP0_KTERU|nr:HAMP domain-containing sensor histidine kinase [Ktedonosporobacter rubrisoli]QBD77655.1 HAMP domain-containing histidine kinase [Ktedonosporobacter rubrisoli]